MTTPRQPSGNAGFLGAIWDGLGGDSRMLPCVSSAGEGVLPSVFDVTGLAAASVGAASLAVAELVAARTGQAPPAVAVDRRRTGLWFGWSLKPEGWTPEPPWDPIAGDYRAADGWIRLHTNAPHHRAAALAVLRTAAEKDAVAAAVAGWRADELEAAVVAAGGCAATMRSLEDWAAHPQGRAAAAEPLVAWESAGAGGRDAARAFDPARPLAGIRVLDLTRILAGPVATRFLAGFGAEVLRIDPPGWEEPSVVPEVTLGKRCARLDLRDSAGRARLLALLAEADVLVHGYRPGALEGLGLGAEARRAARPGLVEVTLDAYGWSGPWAGRRGFDSLVQMSAGIAEAGMLRLGRERPTPLPVQALDHATGYLMAAAAARGLTGRLAHGRGCTARLSLARTAALLASRPAPEQPDAPARPEPADYAPEIEVTPWGPAHRLRPPAAIAGIPLRWDRPAAALGSSPPEW
ncbi:MAG TPA: CoA transferase [Hyphomicrobiales bacterium]|nr:CoA transferase [Hyphomicrobiales bacterium]